ncbi:MAG: hypothetical protein ACERKV_00765 [Clostridiaceae bacterium]
MKKNGSLLIAKIDVEDIDKVKEMGTWFAEWNKDFNSYLVQNISQTKINKKGKPLKQSLQSVILDTDVKAPINHIDGDTLDNRKSNLKLVETDVNNDYEMIDDSTISVILRDKNGKDHARALISKRDLNNVITGRYNWVEYRKNNDIFVLANTPKGKVYLDRLLMNPEIGESVYHINLNPLDCRRKNMKKRKIN